MLNYLNDLQFLLVNLRDAGFQDQGGNIVIRASDQIRDHRAPFGELQSNFGKTSKLRQLCNL